MFLKLDRTLQSLSPESTDFAVASVDAILRVGLEAGASDIHLQAESDGLRILYRLDGVLHDACRISHTAATNVITRLKVLAGLLTYEKQRPQEGRIRDLTPYTSQTPSEPFREMRVSVFPTLHGEKAVVRIFASESFRRLGDLGMSDRPRDQISQLLSETSGSILFVGPAGSGKTTSAYASLREITLRDGPIRSIASIEDPIESAIDRVAQSQVDPNVGFDLAAGLRFLMRQDPEVILVGEIRDRETAAQALSASLSGHLLLSTFHAGGSTEAIGRLLDMGIEPYIIRSGMTAVVGQRLVRQLCECSQPIESEDQLLGLPVSTARVSVGCQKCNESGYQGRRLMVETALPGRGDLARAILTRSDTTELQAAARRDGMIDLASVAFEAVELGITSPAEVHRVFGTWTLAMEPGDDE